MRAKVGSLCWLCVQFLHRVTLPIIYLNPFVVIISLQYTCLCSVLLLTSIQAERSSCVKTGLNNENIAAGVAIIKLYNFTLEWCFALL